MYCSKCGTENNDDAGFCGKCGAPLKKKKERKFNVNKQITPNLQKFKSNKQNLIICIVTIIIIAAIIIGTIMILNNNNSYETGSTTGINMGSAGKDVTIGHESLKIPNGFQITSSNQLMNQYNSKLSSYYDYYYMYFENSAGEKIYIDVGEFSSGRDYTESTLDYTYNNNGRSATVNGEHGYYIDNGKYPHCFVYAKNGKVIGIASTNSKYINEIVS